MSAKTAGDPSFASTLARGIDILLCFDATRPVLGNKELAERTGLSRPTVVRLTHTLTKLGYLRFDAEHARYRLGAAVLTMAYPMLANMRIRPIARPLMQAAAQELRGSVSLGTRHLTQMVYVETARYEDKRLFTPDLGAPLPMLSTAIGRAWLCGAPGDERHTVLNRLRVGDPSEFDRWGDEIPRWRAEFERDGYCASRGAWRRDIHGFALPLRGVVDATLFVVNCGVLAGEEPFAAVRKRVGPRLMTLARSLETLLGLS